MNLPFAKATQRRTIPADLAIIQSMVIPAFVLDRDRKVVVWNSALEELTGVPATQVMNTSDHWRGFYDQQRPCLADLLFDGGSNGSQNLYVAQSGGAGNERSRMAENWCTMPVRGAKRYLVIDASAILDANGHLVAVVETLRDTTAEQEAKTALIAQKEEQGRLIAEQLASASRKMGTALSALASGDLTYRITEPLPGPIDELRASFNSAIEQLESVIRRTLSTAATISRGSDDLATSAEDMSRRAEQQAANLEETAAALTLIMDTVKHTAGGATHARAVVATTREDVARSGEIVQDAVEAMSGVDRSSKEISQIVGVIDEIAFQTNLLALNAGVEAARAGEVGRGFAVVAAEVRALAQRSAESSKEIKALMANSATHVQRGVALVSQAGTALTGIVTQIADIDGVVAEFARSTQDQVRTLTEINSAVVQMDKVTQQNAGMAQDTTTISQQLRTETAHLDQALQRFQVHRDAEAPQRGTVKRKPAYAGPQKSVPQMKTLGVNGGAARKPQPVSDDWQEF